ncbi:hypothetical protein J4448_03155 [Candidatus Woesearchaeota archaeon]|nr:hypothetical protein [Candidatus Woesearchaeota archaeon]
MDFAIALLLFTFTLVVYFSYTTNFQKQEKGELNTLLTDAKAMSSSLTLSGYPANWDNTTVIRIGIADEQKVNATKVKSFKQLNYTITKKKFGTVYDYVVFFVNEKGEIININGVCAIGYPSVNVSYNIKSAYYYQDPADSFLKDFMNNVFKADIYFDDQNNDIYGLDGLMSNLSKYSLVVIEHPLLSGGDYNKYYRELNNYTARGGYIIISGELTTSGSGPDLNGIRFWKKTGQSEPERAAIVNNSDQYLALNVGDAITFIQYYFVTNNTVLPIETDPNDDDYNPFPAVNFKIIASFNKTPEDYAIAKWQYGNGTVYFFSDFDVPIFNGDFIKVVEDLSLSFIEGTCNPINVTGISKNKLVKTERYLTYNSKIVRMIIYLWQ